MKKLAEGLESLEAEFKANIVSQEIQNENKMLKEKVAHLESLLKHSKYLSLKVSAEEQICTEQIFILKEKSSERELSLEEVKRLDILVKNLKLIRGDDTVVNATASNIPAEEAELVAIARG